MEKLHLKQCAICNIEDTPNLVEYFHLSFCSATVQAIERTQTYVQKVTGTQKMEFLRALKAIKPTYANRGFAIGVANHRPRAHALATVARVSKLYYRHWENDDFLALLAQSSTDYRIDAAKQ